MHSLYLVALAIGDSFRQGKGEDGHGGEGRLAETWEYEKGVGVLAVWK